MDCGRGIQKTDPARPTMRKNAYRYVEVRAMALRDFQENIIGQCREQRDKNDETPKSGEKINEINDYFPEPFVRYPEPSHGRR